MTGSCHLIETDSGTRVLVDCGMFQGYSVAHQLNGEPFPFDPRSLDAVILTHAHIDHIGRYPKLVRDGFGGRCFVTHPTRLLSRLMWRDAAQVMKDDARRHRRPPAYTPQEVDPAFQTLHGMEYGVRVKVSDGFHFTFREAGHIFGSAFVEIEADGKRLVMSGDIGNDDVPILRDTAPRPTADAVVCESTYGDRNHESVRERSGLLKQAIMDVVGRKGTLMIPAFSLERTQEVLYELNGMAEGGEIPRIPIYLDSPLAIKVLPVYHQFPEYYDRDAAELSKTDDFFRFPGLHISREASDSRAIDSIKPPKVIIAGSGMMHGGRIMRHLVQYLDDPENILLVIGYQAEGTLGRQVTDGANRVHIEHEDVDVRCEVRKISGYSAHGDREKLLRWLKGNGGSGRPAKIVLNHGELGALENLADHCRKEIGAEVFIPGKGETVEV